MLANVFVVGGGLTILMFSANPTIAKLGFLLVASLVASGYTAIVLFSRLAQTGRAWEVTGGVALREAGGVESVSG